MPRAQLSFSQEGGELVGTAKADESKRRDFEAKRAKHYNKMVRPKKKPGDSSDESDGSSASDAGDANAKDAEVSRGGQWAFGPDDLHGGPKLPDGQKQRASFASQSGGEDCVAEIADEPVPFRRDAAPKRPALRKSEELRRPSNGRRLVWDEETIAEHDLERGTRQKIEEPNTPWIASPQLSNEASPNPAGSPVELEGKGTAGPEANAISNKLHAWYNLEKHRVSVQERWEGSNQQQSSASSDTPRSVKDDFAQKRKQHYNEMDMVRKAMANRNQDDDQDDDEQEEEEKDVKHELRAEDDLDKEKPEDEDEETKKAAFAAKRKQHYNEMDLVRKMMAAKLEDEDDDDEDEDD